MCIKPIPEYARTSERVNHALIPSITNDRIDNFYTGLYATPALGQVIDRARFTGPRYVKMKHWPAPGMGKPTFEEATTQLNSPRAASVEKGLKFGPSWTNHWLRVSLSIPEQVRDREIIFEFDPFCEAMIYTEEGLPLHAITGGPNSMKDGRPGTQEDARIEHVVPAAVVQTGSYTMIIEVSANGMFGVGMDDLRYNVPVMDKYFELRTADIVVPNIQARGLWQDFRILAQVARSTEMKASSLAPRALHACNEIMSAFRRFDGDTEDPSLLDDCLRKCRDIAWGVLGPLDQESKALTAPHKQMKTDQAKIWAIGHCHIDTAWLWRYTQTQQKVARSWSTQCDLMDRWPNHQFAASSAQQYEWLEQLYPSAFERVKKYVEEGRFHPVGGAWLEHDCMLPSGESLVRQYVYGQAYFKEKFGSYSREAWLPDTFGYAVQLPQILRLAGVNYFFTQKLSWNNINVFPHSTFNWVSLDGSQVLAHMTPTNGYNSQCNYDEILKGVWNNKNLAVTDECLFLFGNGDGGGGPTPMMLEKLERLSSLARHHGEVPNIEVAKPVEFFDHLCEKTHGGEDLPTWRGELYLEFHRGTYTTQASLKSGNRFMEQHLRDLEYFATLAMASNSSYEYPKAELDLIWKDVLLNQFHDVLPGTTISLVIDDVNEMNDKNSRKAKDLIDQALNAIYPQSKSLSAPVNQSTLIIDPIRTERSELVANAHGEYILIQTDKNGLGSILPTPLNASAPLAWSEGHCHVLENDHFKLVISGGRITSLFDKRQARELILAGPGAPNGGLNLYEDYPLRYDAWDAEIYHLDMCTLLTFDEVVLEQTPLRSSLTAIARFGKSVAELKFSLDATWDEGDARSPIRVDARIDWHEKHKFLKFALPLDIHAAHATYGTQFGLVERPTHRNTTQDQAKFEVCGQVLGDLSEAGYGVTMVSRTKYGYAVEGNTMRLSLLRAPTTPDLETDQGHHEFEFAIMPHVGRLIDGDVCRKAMQFTNPMYFRELAGTKPALPEFHITGPLSRGVVLETIKRSEDGKSVILRLYESLGGRASGKLQMTGWAFTHAEWVNILENSFETEEGETKWVKTDTGLEVDLNLRCFEIKTLKLRLP